jgi:hypothetical protein
MKITKSQLVEAIEKEVTRLNKISIMENRLTELNRERKILSEGNISPEDITSNPAIEKLTQNPEFQNVIKYLKQHPEEVDALEDAKKELDAITEGRKTREEVKEMLKDLGFSTLVGGFITGMFTTIPGLDISTIIEVILAGAGVGAAAGVHMIANKDYADNLGEIPVSFEDDEEEDLDNINEGDLPSISPESLIDPMETEVVQNIDGEDIKGVELIELTWQDENELFGDKDGDGILAREFSDIFSKESMESYTGREIKDHHLPIEREMLWFRLIAPIAFHYMYGEEGKWYSKSEAANMAKERGKKYVIAQYMS